MKKGGTIQKVLIGDQGRENQSWKIVFSYTLLMVPILSQTSQRN